MVIQPASLWGALTAPVLPVVPDVAPMPGLGLAHSSVSSAQAPMAAGTNSDLTCNLLLPEQIQHMIEAAVTVGSFPASKQGRFCEVCGIYLLG